MEHRSLDSLNIVHAGERILQSRVLQNKVSTYISFIQLRVTILFMCVLFYKAGIFRKMG